MRKSFPLIGSVLPRLVFCLAALCCAAGLYSAAALAANFPTPAGWRADSFRFPLAFAPSIPYDGTQSVRFAPTFARFGTPAGFTHVVLWDIKPEPLEGTQLERAIAVYLDGLMDNVARGRKLDELPVPAAVNLHPMGKPAGWDDAYAGTVHTWNAFSRGEELRIEIEATTRRCAPDHLQVLLAMSMASRRDAAWRALREVRAATTCEAPAPPAGTSENPAGSPDKPGS